MLSVIIPAYRAQNFIVETIASLKNQTMMVNMEIIVVIDGCEATRDAVQHLHGEDCKIYYCPNNMGRYTASNTGVALSSGDELLMFDSDDLGKPHLLETIEKNKQGVDLIRFGYQRFQDTWDKVYKHGNEHGVIRKDLFDLKPRRILYKPSTHCANGILWMRKTVWLALGGYKNWKCSSDTEFLKRFSLTSFEEKRILEPLFLYRQHGGSLTNTINMKQRYLYHKQMNDKNYGKQDIVIKPEINSGYFLHQQPQYPST